MHFRGTACRGLLCAVATPNFGGTSERHAFHKHQPPHCCFHRLVQPSLRAQPANCTSQMKATERLLPACSQGDLKRMGRLMKAGADVNAGDYDKRRPLHIAAAEINLPAVRAVGAAVDLMALRAALVHLRAHSCCCLQATWPDGGNAEVLLVSLGSKCHCGDLAWAAAVQATKVASAEGCSASGLCSMRYCTHQGLPQTGPFICMLRLCADQDAGGAGQGRSECEGPLGTDPPGGGNKEQRQ